MADDIDRAQEINEQFQASVLARFRRGEPLCLPSGAAVCVDCGEDIPEARRMAMPGCKRCIACQTLHEQRGG